MRGLKPPVKEKWRVFPAAGRSSVWLLGDKQAAGAVKEGKRERGGENRIESSKIRSFSWLITNLYK